MQIPKLSGREQKEIIEYNFKGVEKAMVQTLKSRNINEYGFK